MTRQSKVTIAIPTYLREQVLVDTIRQVLALDPRADEVLVIDQTPEHEADTEQVLRAWDASGMIRWIRQSPPNLPAARNRALLETKCDVVLFLDDDVLLEDSLVERHRSLYADPGVWAVCGMVVGNDRKVQPMSQDCALRLGPTLPANSNVNCFGIPMLRGGHHSVRKDRAIAVGGYDESFVGSALAEDLDMAMRFGGDHILTTNQCRIVHLAAPAGGCRSTDGRANIPEWTRTVSAFIAIFRYGRRFPRLICIWLWIALRSGPLRKNVVTRPLRWPMAWISLGYAACEGWRRAFAGVQSSFTRSQHPWRSGTH